MAGKARQVDAVWWLEQLPALIGGLARDWSFTPGRSYTDGTEAVVIDVDLHDGTPAVLKLPIPRPDPLASREILALRLAEGRGCVDLLRYVEDLGRGTSAMLLERLGPSMYELDLPVARRHELLVSAVTGLWRRLDPADAAGLEDGRTKARRLVDRIPAAWEALGRPCSRRAVAHAVACGSRRAEAYDPNRAVLVHGDPHQWNAVSVPVSVASGAGVEFRLVDPDGVVAEPEHDLGVLMREDPVDLVERGPWERARRLAALTGTDPTAIWEWGVIERVACGLDLVAIGVQPVGDEMLFAADAVAADNCDEP